MSTTEDNAKKYYFPLRNPDDPRQYTWLEVSYEQYKELRKMADAIYHREKAKGRCRRPVNKFRECDGVCDYCRYRKHEDILSGDIPDEEGLTLFDRVADPSLPTEEEQVNNIMLGKMMKKLNTVDSKDKLILEAWDTYVTSADAAEALNLARTTYNSRVKATMGRCRTVLEDEGITPY